MATVGGAEYASLPSGSRDDLHDVTFRCVHDDSLTRGSDILAHK